MADRVDGSLFGLEAEFVQDADNCADDTDSYNCLTVKTEDAGGGKYFVIETKRWSFDKIEDLVSVLKRFEKMLEVNNE